MYGFSVGATLDAWYFCIGFCKTGNVEVRMTLSEGTLPVGVNVTACHVCFTYVYIYIYTHTHLSFYICICLFIQLFV